MLISEMPATLVTPTSAILVLFVPIKDEYVGCRSDLHVQEIIARETLASGFGLTNGTFLRYPDWNKLDLNGIFYRGF